ncbi:hypothetical protein [Candidatus Bartonella washoeensis]|uniref:hypothetical protein n=1 Tax=Candidatus Bartonella washoeensis TaxID=186739 RepID=UPI000684953C|nr:hypothetical protein [Bartonella washoeensis]
MKQRKYNNVGDDFAGLNSNVKNVNSHLTNVVNNFTQKINDITQEVKGDALLWSNEAGAFVAQHGEGKPIVKLSFLQMETFLLIQQML